MDGIILVLIMVTMVSIGLAVLKLRGEQRPKLSPETRAEIDGLEEDRAEIVRSIDSCRRILLSNTVDSLTDHFSEKIEILQDRIAAIDRAIARLRDPIPEIGRPTEGIPAVTSGCGHPDLVEVKLSTGEVVAYICTKCNAKVETTDRAAVAHQGRE